MRDRYGEDAYIRDQGRTEGFAEGISLGKTEGISLGRAEGIVQGKAEDILQLLGDLGEVPGTLKERIQKETNPQVLSGWLRAAARANNITEFETQM